MKRFLVLAGMLSHCTFESEPNRTISAKNFHYLQTTCLGVELLEITFDQEEKE